MVTLNLISYFTKMFLKFTGIKYGIMTALGRDAIFFAIASLNLKKDAEIMIPAFSSKHVLEPILYFKLKPILIDIDPETLNINPDLIEEKITNKTKVIIAHHTYGFPLNVKKIRKICDDNNIIFIEDCAQALGCQIDNNMAGKYGDISVFSLTKNMVNFEGGMICTDNEHMFRKIVQYINDYYCQLKHNSLKKVIYMRFKKIRASLYSAYGYRNNFIEKVIKKYKKYKKNSLKPYNPIFRPTWFSALISIIQLTKLMQLNIKRIKNARMFNDILKNINGVRCPGILENDIFGSPLYLPFFCDNYEIKKRIKSRFDRFKMNLLIEPWKAVSMMPQFKKQRCPRAENVSKSILILPNSPRFNKRYLIKIATIIRESINAKA